MGNFPSQQIADLNGSFVGETVSNLQELSNMGIPRSEEELKQRLNDYFSFCAEKNFRPGIESMCLSLGTTRQNFWKWCSGNTEKSEEWKQTCIQAKQCVLAFLESAGICGKINPATLIFALKNWGNYQDSVQVESISSNDRPIDRIIEYPNFSI